MRPLKSSSKSTMKSLFLLRHAKSSWSESGLSDENRPLNKRGKHDAPLMGERFRQLEESLDLILTSSALRARQTAELFANACGYPPEGIVEESELYLSGRRSVEDVLAIQDDCHELLMLVFHNPGITDIVNLCDAAIRIDNVPTCGLVKLSSDIRHWRDWSWSKAQFQYFDYPKNLSDTFN